MLIFNVIKKIYVTVDTLLNSLNSGKLYKVILMNLLIRDKYKEHQVKKFLTINVNEIRKTL